MFTVSPHKHVSRTSPFLVTVFVQLQVCLRQVEQAEASEFFFDVLLRLVLTKARNSIRPLLNHGATLPVAFRVGPGNLRLGSPGPFKQGPDSAAGKCRRRRQGTEPPMGTGDGDDPRSPANRGWGWSGPPIPGESGMGMGMDPDPRRAGDRGSIPDPRQIGDRDGDRDRGFRVTGYFLSSG